VANISASRPPAGQVDPNADGVDVSERDVSLLQGGALGLAGIMLLSLASAAPLIGALGNIPLGIGLGNGQGMAAGFIWVTIVLLLFSAGYAAMANKLTAAGGFYSFISHGIGRPFGLAAGWSALFGYLLVEVALIGAVGYFGHNTFATLFHIHMSWVVYAFVGIAICTALSWSDVRLSAKVLGVALVVETVALLIMDFAVLFKGGPSGTPLSPLNPVNAFKGLAPGVGIFFAFWSYLGFEVVPNYAEESKNPRKHTRIGLYAAVLIIGVLYVLTTWAGVVGHGTSAVVKSATSDPINFYYSIAGSYVGTWLADVMKVFVVTSAIACALAFHQTTCRYFYALGRERILPRRLGRTHPRWESPYVAVLLQGVLVALAVGAFIGFWYISKPAQTFSTNFANAPYFELFGWMAIATTFFVLLNQVLSSAATVAFFRRKNHRADAHWWSTLVAPVLGGAGMAAALYLLISNLTTVGGDIIFVKLIPWVCIAWFLVGLGLALWVRARRPERYSELGRLVNRSLVIGEGEPVEDAAGPPSAPSALAER
jgi:amino acid transporter